MRRIAITMMKWLKSGGQNLHHRSIFLRPLERERRKVQQTAKPLSAIKRGLEEG